MIGAAPPRFSIWAKFSAHSKAARISPTAKAANDRRGACEAGFDECLAPAARPDQVGPASGREDPIKSRLGVKSVLDGDKRVKWSRALGSTEVRVNSGFWETPVSSGQCDATVALTRPKCDRQV